MELLLQKVAELSQSIEKIRTGYTSDRSTVGLKCKLLKINFFQYLNNINSYVKISNMRFLIHPMCHSLMSLSIFSLKHRGSLLH